MMSANGNVGLSAGLLTLVNSLESGLLTSVQSSSEHDLRNGTAPDVTDIRLTGPERACLSD